MKKIRALFKYANKYRGRYLLGILFLLVVDIGQLIPPKLIGHITDNISNRSATEGFILRNIVYIILISFTIAAGRFIWRVFIVGTSRFIEYDIRNNFFKHLQTLSVSFYNKNKTGDLMALATNDLNAVRMALGQGIIMMTDAIVLTFTTIGIMMSISVKLTLMALIPLPFVALTASKFGKQIHRKFTRVQRAFSKLTDMVQENFSGIRIVKSFVQEEKEYERFTKENEHYFDTNMSFLRIQGVFSPLIELIASLSFVLLIGLGGIFVIYGDISLGEFVTFNMYLGNLVWPMMAIGWVINIIQRGFASLERIEKVMDEKTDIYDKDVESTEDLKGDIEMKDLTFTYPGAVTQALKNINLHIKEGQTLGIVGRTGSGKSTIVNLLVRLFELEDGQVYIKGRDINKIPLAVLRENIGFVTQDAFLFSTSLAENINLAKEQLSMEEVIQSAKDADIYDNIINFPEQFDTVIGERGVTLSGGQKQRISISRALIKQPDILILDDCLSAVDAKTEVKILENLERIMHNRTSIIISHRISAVKSAEQIAVLDEGEIVERGTHSELLEKKGIYYDIYQKQLIEQEIQEEGEA